MGYIMVLHPGHPLVGRVAPMVRRNGRRTERQWVIELPDGSRQYVPIPSVSPAPALADPSIIDLLRLNNGDVHVK